MGDLGCCKVIERLDENCTSEYGSPAYTSPEVWRTGVCSHKSDVWSLGCVAYEMMMGRTPFSTPELAHKVLSDEPPALSSVFSAELRQVVSSMLAKDPLQRPSMKDVLKTPYVAQRALEWMRVS